jgi:hypothetical protein
MNRDQKYIEELHSALMTLSQEHGRDVPSRYVWTEAPTRVIEHDKRWRARISPDCRMMMARTSPKQIGMAPLAAPCWTMVQIEVFGDMRAIYNLRGKRSEIFLRKPGIWESWFGIDSKHETIAKLPWLFRDPNDPAWQAFEASTRNQWPPVAENDDGNSDAAA